MTYDTKIADLDSNLNKFPHFQNAVIYLDF